MGRACIDQTLILPPDVSWNHKFPILNQWQSGGGQAATAAVVVSLLGGKSQYVGVLGEDEAGDFLLREFAEFGVCTENVLRVKDYHTPKAYILVNEDNGERTVLYEPTPEKKACPLPLSDIARARTLILDPEISRSDLHKILQIRGDDCYIIYDAERWRSSFEDMMEHADFFIASETILDIEADKQRLEMLDYLFERIRGHWLLTFGSLGSLWLDKDGCGWHVAALPDLKVVDTTGAGDVYHAAFAWNYPRTKDIVSAMKFATVCAGFSVGFPGTRHQGLFDHDKINARLADVCVQKLDRPSVQKLLCGEI